MIKTNYLEAAKNSSIYSGIASFKIDSASAVNSDVERTASPNAGFAEPIYLRKPTKNSRTSGTWILSK